MKFKVLGAYLCFFAAAQSVGATEFSVREINEIEKNCAPSDNREGVYCKSAEDQVDVTETSTWEDYRAPRLRDKEDRARLARDYFDKKKSMDELSSFGPAKNHFIHIDRASCDNDKNSEGYLKVTYWFKVDKRPEMLKNRVKVRSLSECTYQNEKYKKGGEVRVGKDTNAGRRIASAVKALEKGENAGPIFVGKNTPYDIPKSMEEAAEGVSASYEESVGLPGESSEGAGLN